MRKSIISLLLAAAGLCAVASAASFTVNQPFPQSEQGMQNLLLKAVRPGVGVTEPGKTRIPIPAEGVIYEVIVATPGEPRLFPANANKAD